MHATSIRVPDLRNEMLLQERPRYTTTAKRKPTSAPDDTRVKKTRVGPSTYQSQLPSLQLDEIIKGLAAKYDIQRTSIISSTSINKRVDRVLAHLGQYHPTNLSVLPGVVLLHARASDASKMVSVLEIVKRRIHETDQKWYQYNKLYEVPEEVAERSVVEDTVMLGKAEDDDDFEVMPAPHERALQRPAKTKLNTFACMFFSRVPMPEITGAQEFTLQTNEEQIMAGRRKRGVVY